MEIRARTLRSDAFASSATFIHKCWWKRRRCADCTAARRFRTLLEISRHDGASEFVVVHRDDSSVVEIVSGVGCPQVRLGCSECAHATRDDVAAETCPQANRCDARASESSRRGRNRRTERTSDARSLSTDTALHAYHVETLGARWSTNSTQVLVHKTFASSPSRCLRSACKALSTSRVATRVCPQPLRRVPRERCGMCVARMTSNRLSTARRRCMRRRSWTSHRSASYRSRATGLSTRLESNRRPLARIRAKQRCRKSACPQARWRRHVDAHGSRQRRVAKQTSCPQAQPPSKRTSRHLIDAQRRSGSG